MVKEKGGMRYGICPRSCNILGTCIIQVDESYVIHVGNGDRAIERKAAKAEKWMGDCGRRGQGAALGCLARGGPPGLNSLEYRGSTMYVCLIGTCLNTPVQDVLPILTMYPAILHIASYMDSIL